MENSRGGSRNLARPTLRRIVAGSRLDTQTTGKHTVDLRTKAEMGQQQKGKRQSPKFFGPFCVIFSLHFFLCLLFISLSRIPSGFRLTWQVIRSHSFLCCMRTRKLYEVHILQGFFPPSGGSPSQPGSQLGTCDSKLGAFLTA